VSYEVIGQSQISTSAANAVVPLYSSLVANTVQGAPSQIPNQRHSLSFFYQEGSQVYYNEQSTLGPLRSEELGSCLQSYGTVSYTGIRASVPQPELVVVIREVHTTNVLTPVSTSGIFLSGNAQPITERTLQGENKGQIRENSD
jgi:hypothetical protein